MTSNANCEPPYVIMQIIPRTVRSMLRLTIQSWEMYTIRISPIAPAGTCSTCHICIYHRKGNVFDYTDCRQWKFTMRLSGPDDLVNPSFRRDEMWRTSKTQAMMDE